MPPCGGVTEIYMIKDLFNLTSHSPEETEGLGAELADRMLNDTSLPRFVAFYGDLGSGKTAFIRGFTSVVSPTSAVRSPTFTIVNEYRGGFVPVFHFDMYRIDGEDDLYSIGFYDYLSKGICLCEWSENIGFALPEEYIKIDISRSLDAAEENTRQIRASAIFDE